MTSNSIRPGDFGIFKLNFQDRKSFPPSSSALKMPMTDPIESSAILQGMQSLRERSRSRGQKDARKGPPRSRSQPPGSSPAVAEAALATSVSNEFNATVTASFFPPVPVTVTVLVHPSPPEAAASAQEVPEPALSTKPEAESRPMEEAAAVAVLVAEEHGKSPELTALEQEFAKSLGQKMNKLLSKPPPPQDYEQPPRGGSAPLLAVVSSGQPEGDGPNHEIHATVVRSAITGGGAGSPKRHVQLSPEALESAVTTQWPPMDQVNHEKVDAYQRLEEPKEKKLPLPLQRFIPHQGGGEEGRRGRRWFNFDLNSRTVYSVSPALKTDWKVQASFFARFMILKTFQLAIINGWIAAVGFVPDLRTIVQSYHDWLTYFPLGIFFLLLTMIRICGKRKVPWYSFPLALAIILLSLLIAIPLAAVAFTYEAYCILVTTGTLLFTCLSLPFCPYLTQTPVTTAQVTRVGSVLVLAYAIIILVVVAYMGVVPDMGKFAALDWFPGILLAEGTLWVTIQEFQRVLAGACFHVTENQWAFTALYV